MWAGGLIDAGYSVISTVDLAASRHPGTLDLPEPLPEGLKRIGPRPRRYFNLTAARGALAMLPGLSFDEPEDARLAFPEKYLSARVRLGQIAFDVHNAHVPDAATVGGAIKIRAFEAIRQRVDQEPAYPRVLCGDFNCQHPDEEYRAGKRPRRRVEWKARWDEAEYRVTDNPELPDVYRVYREMRPTEDPFPASVYVGRRRKPMRYDHIFASSHFKVVGCEYLRSLLEQGLSDHAAVVAKLSLDSGAPVS